MEMEALVELNTKILLAKIVAMKMNNKTLTNTFSKIMEKGGAKSIEEEAVESEYGYRGETGNYNRY